MAISHFSQFLDGVVIRDKNILSLYPGKVFYVDNSTTPLVPGGNVGNDSRNGTISKPLATIARAVSLCVANRGDIIMVGPGHAESIASSTAMALNKAGVAIVGMGVGTMRPTLTLTTANTATIAISAANVTLHNLIVVANFLNVAAAVTVSAAECTLSEIEFRDTSSVLNVVNPIVTSTTSNACDGLVVKACRYDSKSSSGSALISNAGTHDRVTIEDNHVFMTTGDFPTLVIGASTKLLTTALIRRNRCYQTATTVTGACFIRLATAAGNTGIVHDNMAYTADSSGTVLVTASSGFALFNNLALDTAGASGILNPAADTLA